MSTVAIRPGILVSLKTRITGGVRYDRQDLPVTAPPPDGADVSRWETTRVIEDPQEFERARRARGLAATAIRRFCIPSEFGLLCPASREADLDAGIADARRLADEHNAGANRSHVEVYALKGRVAATDEEAVRAISSEVRGLLDSVESGIARLDVGAVREAAARAKRLGQMLDPAAGEKVAAAVAEARQVARAIVKRVQGEGESAASVIEEVRKDAIKNARFAFLDLDGATEPPALAPAPEVVQRAAGLDMEAL